MIATQQTEASPVASAARHRWLVTFIVQNELTEREWKAIYRRAEAERRIEVVTEQHAGGSVTYKKLGEYLIAMTGLCGGKPVIRYTRPDGTAYFSRINAGVLVGWLQEGRTPEEVAADYGVPIAAVIEARQLADVYDYEWSYA